MNRTLTQTSQAAIVARLMGVTVTVPAMARERPLNLAQLQFPDQQQALVFHRLAREPLVAQQPTLHDL